MTGESSKALETSAQGQGLTGDVYELTVEDARMILMSDQLVGKIWLTDTYGANTTSFITIPISDKLTYQFTTRLPQVM